MMIAILIGFYLLGFSNEKECEPIQAWLKDCQGFEANLGQVCSFEGNPVNNVLFSAYDNNLGIFIADKGVSYLIYQPEKSADERLILKSPSLRSPDALLHYARIDLELINARIDVSQITYEEELPGYANYYLPQCPNGVLFVKRYRKVRIKEIYPKIDWVWKYDKGEWHHEFEVSKDADIDAIKLKIKYADYKLVMREEERLKSPIKKKMVF